MHDSWQSFLAYAAVMIVAMVVVGVPLTLFLMKAGNWWEGVVERRPWLQSVRDFGLWNHETPVHPALSVSVVLSAYLLPCLILFLLAREMQRQYALGLYLLVLLGYTAIGWFFVWLIGSKGYQFFNFRVLCFGVVVISLMILFFHSVVGLQMEYLIKGVFENLGR